MFLPNFPHVSIQPMSPSLVTILLSFVIEGAFWISIFLAAAPVLIISLQLFVKSCARHTSSVSVISFIVAASSPFFSYNICPQYLQQVSLSTIFTSWIWTVHAVKFGAALPDYGFVLNTVGFAGFYEGVFIETAPTVTWQVKVPYFLLLIWPLFIFFYLLVLKHLPCEAIGSIQGAWDAFQHAHDDLGKFIAYVVIGYGWIFGFLPLGNGPRYTRRDQDLAGSGSNSNGQNGAREKANSKRNREGYGTMDQRGNHSNSWCISKDRTVEEPFAKFP